MIKKFEQYITEKLGVADATLYYIDVLAEFCLNKTIEFHKIYADKPEKKITKEFTKKFQKSDFEIDSPEYWSLLPINEIELIFTYHKRYDGRHMTDTNGVFTPIKVGGACYGFAEKNVKGESSYMDSSRINRDQFKSINLKLEMNCDIWKTFDESKYDLLLSKFKTVISHELNHLYENYRRKISGKDPLTYGVTYATYSDNKSRVDKSIWKIWENLFLSYIYQSEPHELNAFSQEISQAVENCHFDLEKFKEDYKHSYLTIKRFQEFNSLEFKQKLSKKIKKHYEGVDKILNMLKKEFTDEYKEKSKEYRESGKERYDVSKFEKMTFDEFLKFWEPIFHKSGERLIKSLGRALSRKDEFIKEALLPSQFRDYVLEFNKTRYDDLFKKMKEKYSGDKKAYRIYIPLIKKDNPIENEITNFLSSNGYEVLDYIKGTCKFNGSKNPSKIGQVLTKFEKTNPESKVLMNKFVSDNSRKSGNLNDLMICISRHPYDIAGADTDRSWTNCMTLATPNAKRVLDLKSELEKTTDPSKKSALEAKINGYEREGANVWKLEKDIKYGTIISYLIKKDDKNIENPISNLNIKPYENTSNKKDIILVSDSVMYGQGMPEFKETLDRWLDQVNGIRVSGLYKLKDGIYIDSNTAEIRFYDEPKSNDHIKEILDSLGIENYTVNDDLTVDVESDVNISDIGITKIPVKFNKVIGDFNVSTNRLTSLINSPKEITGDFNCSNNYLTTLVDGPSLVGGVYDCSKNRLKSLDGIGEYKELKSNDNQIKTSIKESKVLKFKQKIKQINEKI